MSEDVFELKPIETSYNGFRFRSRLEARWAVYFDSIGIEWDYETEGYALNSGWYLPDFYLPKFCLWAEVKPLALSELETTKARELVSKTKRRCVLLVGRPECEAYDLIDQDGLTDCVLSGWRSDRFYVNTGELTSRDFEVGGLFDDVPSAVAASRSARF